MLLHTNAWRPGAGWVAPWPAGLDSPTTFAVLFGGGTAADCMEAIDDVAARLPQAVRVGCSTAGGIRDAHVEDVTLTVAVARFASTGMRQVALPIASDDDSFAVGRRLGDSLCSPGLRAVFVLSDGLHVNGSQLAAGLAASLPPGVAVTGGLAGDGERFGTTWVLAGGAPRERQVAAVGFFGDKLRVGHGCDAGWAPFGPERRVTRSTGSVLHELDGKPALALYKSYLGERAAGLPATALLFPLSIRRDADDPHPLIRTILGVDEAAQTLTFAGDIPEGQLARLMRTNIERLIQSAGHAAKDAAHDFPADAAPLAISVSCVGRRLVLGERTDEEIESVRDALPRGAVQVGFYSYGEMSPRGAGSMCDLHNQTMTVTLIDEVA
ncbi:MAG: FIST N-terminal domain-containing protein [Burkholderiales bacterium]